MFLNKFIIFLLFISFAFSNFSYAQNETRAVWVTTNYRLDWPPANKNIVEQKNSLLNIFKDLNKKNFNTIYFQARSSGTVMYNSSFEPLSPYINPDVLAFDPLAFAISSANNLGLEIHAWVNVFRCYPGSESEILDFPNHVVNTNPEWLLTETRSDGNISYWLNPGLPEVREYLVNVISEIVNKYNIDGIHLDFIRYPTTEVDDSETFAIYGNGLSLSDWRRNNISTFIHDLNIAIKNINPTVKLGAAPFGIYKNLKGAVGTEAYTNVYQDAQGWIKNNDVDYLVPQIYWDINTNPRFDILAKDWVNNNNGRNVILGVGAYKPEVEAELGEIIELSRKLNSNGVSFFRYEHIKNQDFTKSFNSKVFPSSTKWLGTLVIDSPYNLNSQIISQNPFTIGLSWQSPDLEISPEYYSVYLHNFDGSNKLLEIIGSEKESIKLVISKQKKHVYFFSVNSVDKLWNESEYGTEKTEIISPLLSEINSKSTPDQKAILISSGEQKRIILYRVNEEQVQLYTVKDGLKINLQENIVYPGMNVIKLNNTVPDLNNITILYTDSQQEQTLKIN